MNKNILAKKIFKRLLALTLLLLCLSPQIGRAETASLNFYVEPILPQSQIAGQNSYFNLKLSPGREEQLTLVAVNSSNQEIELKITPHTAYTNTNGVVEYGKDAEEPDRTLPYSISELIEPIEKTTVKAGERKEITLRLTMPENHFEGILAGGLKIEEIQKKEEVEESEELTIENQFSYIVGVVVQNNHSEISGELELGAVEPGQVNYRNVIKATIQNYTPTFINQLEVEANITKEGQEQILYTSKSDGMQMAPNSHFSYPIPLDGQKFKAGNYMLTMTAKSGEQEWQWKKEFSVTSEDSKRLNAKDVTIEENSTNMWLYFLLGMFVVVISSGIFMWFQFSRRKSKEHDRKNYATKTRVRKRRK